VLLLYIQVKEIYQEVAERGIALGMDELCFTDHIEPVGWGTTQPREPFDWPALETEFRAAQAAVGDQIRLRLGMELGDAQWDFAHTEKLIADAPELDFVIGSVHCIRKSDIAFGDIFKSYSDEEVYRMTFEETLEDVKLYDDFDTLGHLDYMTRYGKTREKEYTFKKYSDIIDEILKVLIYKGKGLELNMAGLKYGLPYAHPQKDVLKRYKELGGEIITIGADGHKPEHIAYDFHKVSGILKECGFAYYTEFDKRKPYFCQVE